MRKTLGCLAIILYPALAWAQQDSLPVHQLGGVEIVETHGHRALASPVPQHGFSSIDMLSMGATSITDVLNRMPGTTVRDYGGAGGMKTLAVRGFSAKYTGLVYDGLVMSDCQTGETDLSRYSLHSVNYIALTVGDAADIFLPARQSAYPALLTIETAGPTPAHRRSNLDAQIEWGSFGFVSPFLKYRKKLSRKVEVSAMGEYTFAENDYPYTIHNMSEIIHQRRANSRMNSVHAELDCLLTPSSLSSWRIKAYYYDNERLLPGIVKYYTTMSGESLDDRNFFMQAVGMVRNRRGDLSLKLSGRFNWMENIYHDKLYADGVNDASYWQRESYASASLLYSPVGKWTFDLAADYAFNNLNSSLSTDTRPYRHSLWQSTTAKYSDGRLTFLARLLGSVFINETQSGEGAHDMSRLSPSLSVSYKLVKDRDFYVRASYKNIFRVPNFNENYYFHYGSPTLRPESTDQLNLGMTFGCQKPLYAGKVSLDAYCNRVRDMIVAVPYNMFVWTCINVEHVRSLGAELSASEEFGLGGFQVLKLQGTYSFQRVTDRTASSSPYYDYQIAYIPLHSGSMSLAWENPWINLSLHGSGVSSRWPNNSHYAGTKVPGYWIMGLTAWRGFRLVGCKWMVRVDVKNVFDKQYSIVSHYPMPGRSWMATVKCEI